MGEGGRNVQDASPPTNVTFFVWRVFHRQVEGFPGWEDFKADCFGDRHRRHRGHAGRR